MIKKTALFFLCIFLFLSIPGCKKKLPTSPDIPTKMLATIEYFYASPESIGWRESSTLFWSVENAPIVYIDQGIGNVSTSANVVTSGTIDVSPEETTTYTLTAVGSSGTASCTVEVTARAIFEMISYDYRYTFYGNCEIFGIIKNVGNATGYNVMVEFQAYSDNVIVGTARGYPADLGNIPVGVKAAFEAIFFNLYNWGVIGEVTYEITWITAQGMILTQTGIVPFK